MGMNIGIDLKAHIDKRELLELQNCLAQYELKIHELADIQDSMTQHLRRLEKVGLPVWFSSGEEDDLHG